MKVKVSTASGPVLDRMVAKLVGKSYVKGDTDYAPDGRIYQRGTAQPTGPHYSTDWAQGGPIIEREGIELRPSRFGATGWTAWTLDRATKTQPRNVGKSASSPLIAAMRCFVSSKLGDEVDIPKELT